MSAETVPLWCLACLNVGCKVKSFVGSAQRCSHKEIVEEHIKRAMIPAAKAGIESLNFYMQKRVIENRSTTSVILIDGVNGSGKTTYACGAMMAIASYLGTVCPMPVPEMLYTDITQFMEVYAWDDTIKIITQQTPYLVLDNVEYLDEKYIVPFNLLVRRRRDAASVTVIITPKQEVFHRVHKGLDGIEMRLVHLP